MLLSLRAHHSGPPTMMFEGAGSSVQQGCCHGLSVGVTPWLVSLLDETQPGASWPSTRLFVLARGLYKVQVCVTARKEAQALLVVAGTSLGGSVEIVRVRYGV